MIRAEWICNVCKVNKTTADITIVDLPLYYFNPKHWFHYRDLNVCSNCINDSSVVKSSILSKIENIADYSTEILEMCDNLLNLKDFEDIREEFKDINCQINNNLNRIYKDIKSKTTEKSIDIR